MISNDRHDREANILVFAQAPFNYRRQRIGNEAAAADTTTHWIEMRRLVESMQILRFRNHAFGHLNCLWKLLQHL